jgi:hypothetical protein
MRRVETALNHTWKQSHVLARGRGSSFRAVYTSARFHGDIQLCNQLRIRMLHFVQNLQYYLSAEVLGNPTNQSNNARMYPTCPLTSNRTILCYERWSFLVAHENADSVLPTIETLCRCGCLLIMMLCL